MIEQQKSEQLKKFSFFEVKPIQQVNDDPQSHPIKLTDVNVSQICLIDQNIILLDQVSNLVSIFTKCIVGYWKPHNEGTFKIATNVSNSEGVLLTYGQDSQGQMKSLYVKFWMLQDSAEDYSKMKPRKLILVSKLGDPQKIVSCLHILPDLTLLTIGTKRGTLNIYESKNLILNDYKMSSRPVDKKQIKTLQTVKRNNQYDLYFTNESAFFWLQNLSEKKKINQQQIEVMEATRRGSVLVAYKSDIKIIYQLKAGKQIKSFNIQGQKRLIREFSDNYLISVIYQKRNQKMQNSKDKYHLQIVDHVNLYIAQLETYSKIQDVLVNGSSIYAVTINQKGQRSIVTLLEKDNSVKIETFFKKSFFNEAWRFAKSQNCQESLLAQISRLHGDSLYTKSDYAGAIKHYILTLKYVEPSYVIRKFLDVSQIDYLIEYLQKIHEKKLAKKQHTALLLNCYVKKQKIQNLSKFLSESALQSDLFDIETAIKVCRDLKHIDQAMKLAQQKNKHKLFLKILIEDKKDFDRALDHIKEKVELEQKEKFLIQFGQQFMKFKPQKTIELIKLLVRAHSISQMVRGHQRDIILNSEQKIVLEKLNFNPQDLQSLTIITFKKPDEYFRLFLANNSDLQEFLIFLVRDISRLPNQQVVFHRLIEFYLQMMKENPFKKAEYQQKILENVNNPSKKLDNTHLLALFKMYNFDEGVITLGKKLNMRDDLLNFYIAKNRDQDILQLCKQHGMDEVNLWIHALKYFVKPDHKRQYYIPSILQSLAKIPNLSPLPILQILSKNKNIEYRYIQEFFLVKLKQDRKLIEKDRDIVKRNMKRAQQSRLQFKKLKTTAKPFLSNVCAECQNGLTFPSMHFMCGHSFHQNCLGGNKICGRCEFQMRGIVERKESLAKSAQNQKILFQTLQERRQMGFQVISEFLGKGMFNKVVPNDQL